MNTYRSMVWGLVGAALLAATPIGCNSSSGGGNASVELLNVSYDPTRELWHDLNAHFVARYEKETGVKVAIKQSHGGSGSQARAIVDGLEADVATLALWSDTEQLHANGLIKEADWAHQAPNGLPYYSTIVFVVRKGNPKGIRAWADLAEKPGVQVVTPNPKTSGNGKLTFLAAWGAVLHNKGTEEQARNFVRKLYQRVPVLDSGARGSTTTFSQNKTGDVHLTWENEALLEVQESKGDLEIVYPPASIKAEPYIAIVDAVVDRRGTRDVAEAYLRSVYDPEAQEIIAQHGYRPIDKEVLARHKDTLPPDLTLFEIQSITPGGWGEAQKKFFSDGAEFDSLYHPER